MVSPHIHLHITYKPENHIFPNRKYNSNVNPHTNISNATTTNLYRIESNKLNLFYHFAYFTRPFFSYLFSIPLNASPRISILKKKIDDVVVVFIWELYMNYCNNTVNILFSLQHGFYFTLRICFFPFHRLKKKKSVLWFTKHLLNIKKLLKCNHHHRCRHHDITMKLVVFLNSFDWRWNTFT